MSNDDKPLGYWFFQWQLQQAMERARQRNPDDVISITIDYDDGTTDSEEVRTT